MPPYAPSVLFLLSSTLMMSCSTHKRLNSCTGGYLVSLAEPLETNMLPKSSKKEDLSEEHMQNKKKIHALAPSHQLLGDLPVHCSHFIVFCFLFFHKQHRTQVIFRVITSKLLLKEKHTLCLYPGSRYEPLHNTVIQ